MRDFGGMVSFLAESEEEAVGSSRGRSSSSSPSLLGGVESLIEHPARMTHASTADAPFAAPRNLVRLSVGIESIDDLIADLEAALVPRRRRTPSNSLLPGYRPTTDRPRFIRASARTVGAYLLDTSEGLSLFDCGPSSCVPALKAGLAERGHELADVRHLLLSHIHLDHAGAAGVLVREHPGLTVWVSEIGAPHLVDPSRLERSARRLYGDAFDELWGELAPVPEENVRVVDDARRSVSSVFPRPATRPTTSATSTGRTLYAGDAAGVRIQPSGRVLPPTRRPTSTSRRWFRTLEEIERRAPERLALIHFGPADDVCRHLGELVERLDEVGPSGSSEGAEEQEFVATGGQRPRGRRRRL